MGVRYTRELLEEAARVTANWDDAVRWCGGTPTPGSRRYLRQKMAEAEVDVSHFPVRWARHTEETLRKMVAVSTSIKEVVRRLGISPVGGNHTHISRRIATLGIDTSHFVVRPGAPRDSRCDVLSLGTPQAGRIPGNRLLRHLLSIGIPETCAMCGTGPKWNDKPLQLEVDHINGGWWDNRLKNLRLLCPNCHAVTDTYRGRRRGTVA
ncbi:HNH endonuclease signature motif containing protein [Streptomyces fulvoviolaceus]|uniref:HNH endonuclease signature motif containing protein n=1 Tax=Streptomyces fulvoviolaceus TaxID=285535 RepID=UPI0004CBE5AC|nr:HNH endonuclease signature motif containing protein [Streptomyces fulvoviolaceus]MCT9082429.1 HNH endonuclease [Streptomyces fulvoviolaceus]